MDRAVDDYGAAIPAFGQSTHRTCVNRLGSRLHISVNRRVHLTRSSCA